MTVSNRAGRGKVQGSSRFRILAGLAVLATAAATGTGLWLTGNGRESAPIEALQVRDQESRSEALAAKQSRPAASKNPAARLPPRTDRANRAMQESSQAREMRELPRPEQRIARFYEQASQAGPEEVARLLEAGADDPSRDVRIETLNALGLSTDTGLQEDLLAEMLEDDDEIVRDLAFHKVNEREVADRVRIFARALDSPDTRTVDTALEYLTALGTRSAVDGLLERAPRHAGTSLEGRFVNAAERIIGQPFGSAALARDWWNRNKAQFEEDMSQVPAP